MKKLYIILIIFSLFFTLCSCDNEEPTNNNQPNTNDQDVNDNQDNKKNNYDVIYVDGGTLTKDTYEEGTNTVEPTKPTKDGYNFAGWYTNQNYTTEFKFGSPITSNITIYGKWEEGFFLTYVSDENETVEFYKKGSKTEEPNEPTKDGFFFGGWYEDSDYKKVFEFGNKIRKDITIYAKWNKGVYLTYNVDGVETKEFVESNVALTEPKNPIKENYVFAGWYTESTLINKFNFKAINKDTTLYAKWGIKLPTTDPVDSLELKDITTLEGYDKISTLSSDEKKEISAGGYVADNIGDFSKYIGTSYYKTVSTPLEFLQAIADAKVNYTNVWDNNNNIYHQIYSDGSTGDDYLQKVHVIEITEDLNLGYNKLSAECKNTGVVASFMKTVSDKMYMSDMVTENGISQISIQNSSNLLIYSKNGAKITHAGFKIGSSNNIVIRNLEFDEIWQWEDSSSYDVEKIGDYDAFGWAYFKISFSGYVWIDHCTFGKSYDGQIDYANPVYDVEGTCSRAPYKANGKNGLHISWCSFNAGSDDPNGYLYKMMEDIEQDYQSNGTSCLYYNVLRDAGASFEDILYGLAIPQKKGFLFGDSGSTDQLYNPKINVSFANCYIKNLEDRLPKLRGGDCYMYNTVIDCSQYYTYRTKLQNMSYNNITSAKNIIAAVKKSDNSKTANWKCALVSQGIVPSQGASVMTENCIFRGIASLIKNNDTGTGCYKMKNCSFQLASTDTVNVITTEADIKPAWTSGTLSTTEFNWNTENGQAPFTVNSIVLADLESYLNNSSYGVGTLTGYGQTLTVCNY